MDAATHEPDAWAKIGLPPGVPEPVVTPLQKAIDKTMKDAGFIQNALNIEKTPQPVIDLRKTANGVQLYL